MVQKQCLLHRRRPRFVHCLVRQAEFLACSFSFSQCSARVVWQPAAALPARELSWPCPRSRQPLSSAWLSVLQSPLHSASSHLLRVSAPRTRSSKEYKPIRMWCIWCLSSGLGSTGSSTCACVFAATAIFCESGITIAMTIASRLAIFPGCSLRSTQRRCCSGIETCRCCDDGHQNWNCASVVTKTRCRRLFLCGNDLHLGVVGFTRQEKKRTTAGTACSLLPAAEDVRVQEALHHSWSPLACQALPSKHPLELGAPSSDREGDARCTPRSPKPSSPSPRRPCVSNTNAQLRRGEQPSHVLISSPQNQVLTDIRCIFLHESTARRRRSRQVAGLQGTMTQHSALRSAEQIPHSL